jgi:MoaA/NifB/PqqE/SkfB family radical SAM enzyme
MLQQMAEKSSMPIEFRGGYINKNLANEVFSHVDAIVVPSIWAENSPLVIHEAQACKIPVITANYGGMAEYVQHKVNGLHFQHRNVDSLQEQLQWAIDHPEELKSYGQVGYLYSEDGTVPNIQDHGNELLKMYRSLLAPKNTLWRITIDTNPEDCNLHCIMCEEHSPFSKYIDQLYQETGSRKRRMPIEWLDKIMEQADSTGIKEIIPSTMGEPLIYSAIERIYDFAKEKNIKINLTTNGTFPRKSLVEWAKIIIPHTSDVKISWNGATKETAELVMKGIDFNQVMHNTKAFISLRDQHYRETGYYCRITFQLTFMQNNMHELAEIVKLAASLNVDRVKGHHLWDHFEEIKTLSMKYDTAAIERWNQFVQEAHAAAERYRRPNGEKVLLENIIPIEPDKQNEIPESYNCPFLNKELWISATGKISPCCAPDKLRDELGDFGNIQTHTISEVLSSDAYSKLVSDYKTRSLCKTCNMRKP